MNYNLVGKTFTWLKVLKFNGINKKQNKEWLCQCKCGKYKIVTTYELLHGKVKSCGCYNRDRYNNLNGKFEKLTILEYVGTNEKHYKLYRCKCDCGKETIVKGCSLLNGHTKSCGCHKKNHLKTHGYCSTDGRLYDIYNAMIHRCYHKNCGSYKSYGKKGIFVCDEWLKNIDSFFNFAYKNGYDKTKTIDRINSSLGYYPENCRFISKRLNTLRAAFKRKYGYDPTDKEIELNYGWKEPI